VLPFLPLRAQPQMAQRIAARTGARA
jgi:hypothetical protein